MTTLVATGPECEIPEHVIDFMTKVFLVMLYACTWAAWSRALTDPSNPHVKSLHTAKGDSHKTEYRDTSLNSPALIAVCRIFQQHSKLICD
jgi:hypothetical protein